MGVVAGQAEPGAPLVMRKEPQTGNGSPGWRVSPSWIFRHDGKILAFDWQGSSQGVSVYNPSNDPGHLAGVRVQPFAQGTFGWSLLGLGWRSGGAGAGLRASASGDVRRDLPHDGERPAPLVPSRASRSALWGPASLPELNARC